MKYELSATEWSLAQEVCTARQAQVLNYARRGWGARSIAATLDLDPSTVRHHLEAGMKKIKRELERRAA